MSLTRLEIALGVVIALLWLVAMVWVHGLHRLRAPLAFERHHEAAAILDEMPSLPAE